MTHAHLPPAPETSEETAAFWSAANEDRLVLRRCPQTGRAFHPPRALSPFTGQADTDWIEASGRGTVYSFSVDARRTPAHCIAYVMLAEGPILLTQLIDCDPASVRIGQAVQAVFVASASGQKLPMFRPLATM